MRDCFHSHSTTLCLIVCIGCILWQWASDHRRITENKWREKNPEVVTLKQSNFDSQMAKEWISQLYDYDSNICKYYTNQHILPSISELGPYRSWPTGNPSGDPFPKEVNITPFRQICPGSYGKLRFSQRLSALNWRLADYHASLKIKTDYQMLFYVSEDWCWDHLRYVDCSSSKLSVFTAFHIKASFFSTRVSFPGFSSNKSWTPGTKAYRGKMNSLNSDLCFPVQRMWFFLNHSHKIGTDFQNKADLLGKDF